MVAKNLFSNSLFWGIAAGLTISIVPAIQKVRIEKQLPIDALLTIAMSIGVGISTVSNLYNSSGNIYYTNKQLPGRNKEDAEVLLNSNNQEFTDGNF